MKTSVQNVLLVSDLQPPAVKLANASLATMSSAQTAMRQWVAAIDAKLVIILTSFHSQPSSASHAQETASLVMTPKPAINAKTRVTCTSRRTSTRMDANVTRKKAGCKYQIAHLNVSAQETSSTKTATVSIVSSCSMAARHVFPSLNQSSMRSTLEHTTRCPDKSLT